jgi:predicted acyl esterase
VVWISLDVPDTDIQVTLSEVLLDGSYIKLAQDYLRARHRESLRHEKLVTPHEINRYVFDRFNFFSRRVAKGSRLRLFISAPTSLILRPNSIYLQRNYNSGKEVTEESGKDARTAHVTLFHGAEHPSYLELPVVI